MPFIFPPEQKSPLTYTFVYPLLTLVFVHMSPSCVRLYCFAMHKPCYLFQRGYSVSAAVEFRTCPPIWAHRNSRIYIGVFSEGDLLVQAQDSDHLGATKPISWGEYLLDAVSYHAMDDEIKPCEAQNAVVKWSLMNSPYPSLRIKPATEIAAIV